MALSTRSSILLVLTALFASGCSVNKAEPPPPTGPSELATSLTLRAHPDTLTQDGVSQSEIVILARDANGQPLPNLPLRAEIAVDGSLQDFGLLSSKNLSTSGDGRASVVYTAPKAVDSVDRLTTVNVLVTPVGTDAAASVPRSVSIRLVPPGVITPPSGVAPGIIASPNSVNVLETVTFSPDFGVDGSIPEWQIATYLWDFGDGSTSGSKTASHQFRGAGSFPVTLTVTTATGVTATRTLSVTVGAGTAPAASFVFSPSAPGVGEEITFNGSASTATPPRTIVKYDWQFGTDRTGSGMVVFKRYDTPGTYNVTLSVTDDAGNIGTATQAVTVGTDSAGGLSAKFTFSPTSPTAGSAVSFNASTSTSADPIVQYQWDFGDGSPLLTTSSPLVTHVFASGSYKVTLRVKDSKDRVSFTSQDVSVF
jgi:PKD repeat protein